MSSRSSVVAGSTKDDALAARTPQDVRSWLNSWQTYQVQGIEMQSIAEDWSEAVMRLDLTPASANAHGTTYGGSMFSMTDGIANVLLGNRLGAGCEVWDTRAEIVFKRPGTGPLSARIAIDDGLVEQARTAMRRGETLRQVLEIEICSSEGEVVARQVRELYVKASQIF